MGIIPRLSRFLIFHALVWTHTTWFDWCEFTELGSFGVSSYWRIVWSYMLWRFFASCCGKMIQHILCCWSNSYYHEEQVGYVKIILCLNFHLKRIDYRECVTSSFDQWQHIRQIHQIAQFFSVYSHQTKCLVWTHTIRTKWCEFIPKHKKSKIC